MSGHIGLPLGLQSTMRGSWQSDQVLPRDHLQWRLGALVATRIRLKQHPKRILEFSKFSTQLN